MKKSFVMLIIVLLPSLLFAQVTQSVATTDKPNTFKQDTTVYAAETYPSDNGRLDGLLLQMKDFELGTGGTIVHNGQAIKYVKINGQAYRGLDAQRASIMLPSNMIHNIEIINIRGQAADGTEKMMNINIKSNRNDQLADILVGARYVSSIYDLKMSRKRRDDLANATPVMFLAPSIGSDKDDYGDQIPHFIILPPPGTYSYKVNLPQARRVRRGKARSIDPAQGNM